MITEDTRRAVWSRTGFHKSGHCEGCGIFIPYNSNWHWHHCYFRSQYKRADMDDEWNGAALCAPCHRSIHDKGNRELADRLRTEADKRKPITESSKIKHPKYKKASKVRKRKYKRAKDRRETIFSKDYGTCKHCNKALHPKRGRIGDFHKLCFLAATQKGLT